MELTVEQKRRINRAKNDAMAWIVWYKGLPPILQTQAYGVYKTNELDRPVRTHDDNGLMFGCAIQPEEEPWPESQEDWKVK